MDERKGKGQLENKREERREESRGKKKEGVGKGGDRRGGVCGEKWIQKWQVILPDTRKETAIYRDFFLRKRNEPWLVWLSGLSAGLQIKGSPVRFPVWGYLRGNRTLMFLSLFFSFTSPPSKNINNKNFEKKKQATEPPPLFSLPAPPLLSPASPHSRLRHFQGREGPLDCLPVFSPKHLSE